METRAQYLSDVTDEQWRILVKLLPPPKGRGRKPIDRRRVLNAILYVVRSGCQWRMLPSTFPCWSRVYDIFCKWRWDEVWQGIHDTLRERVRRAAGKQATPSAAIIDSQSIRNAQGGKERGYDAEKKITGRKRHLVVDTLGLVLTVVVHGPNPAEIASAILRMTQTRDQMPLALQTSVSSHVQLAVGTRLGKLPDYLTL